MFAAAAAAPFVSAVCREVQRSNAGCLVPCVECCCVGLINGVQIKTGAVWMELDGQKKKKERE